MIVHTAFIDDLLAKFFSGIFLGYKVNARRTMHIPRYQLIITILLADKQDLTLGASGLCVGTRIGAGSTATLA